jgi:O-antigen ligase
VTIGGSTAASPAVQRWLVLGGIAVALVAALFFNGIALPFFCASLAGLIVACWIAMLANVTNLRAVASSGVSRALLLFWAWLALSILWSAVPYASVLNFWWLGALPLAFLVYSLSPERDWLWRRFAIVVLVVALVLATVAAYQLVVLGADARATFYNRESLAAFLALVLLPLFAGFLYRPQSSVGERRVVWLIGAAALLLCTVFAMLRGRGATLSGLLALGLLLGVAWKSVARQRVLALLGILLAAVALANTALGGAVGERLVTIVDPASAGATRYIIWRGAWQMLLEAPWFGTGIGTFWMLWPPFRHPADDSGGYYVHNDYLQLWIETGVVGLGLLLAVYVAVAWQFVRALRNAAMPTRDRIEATGLFAGLLAVAAHSFVDFNLYILPILIVAGLALGRLHALCPTCVVVSQQGASAPSLALRTRVLISMLAVLLLAYFGALAGAALLMERARTLAENGALREADQALTWAGRLAPGLDAPLIMHAGLLTRVLDQLPPDFPASSRRAIFEDALALLENAERANRYRADVYYARARLLHRHASKVASEFADGAPAAYREALARDPRFHWARVGLAEWMLEHGEPRAAHDLLEEGIAQWYPRNRDTAVYYEFAARLRRAQGNEQGARELEQRVREMAKAYGASAEQILVGAPGISGASLPAR